VGTFPAAWGSNSEKEGADENKLEREENKGGWKLQYCKSGKSVYYDPEGRKGGNVRSTKERRDGVRGPLTPGTVIHPAPDEGERGPDTRKEIIRRFLEDGVLRGWGLAHHKLGEEMRYSRHNNSGISLKKRSRPQLENPGLEKGLQKGRIGKREGTRILGPKRARTTHFFEIRTVPPTQGDC